MTTSTDGLVERLRVKARAAADISKVMAQAKSLRQPDNPECRADLYAWSEAEQMTEWKAADTIEALTARIAELEGSLEAADRVVQYCSAELWKDGPDAIKRRPATVDADIRTYRNSLSAKARVTTDDTGRLR